MNFNLSLLKENLDNMSLSISDEAVSRLDRFAGMLAEKNKLFNLTAITDPDGIAVKHFADSLSVMTVCDLQSAGKILDLGTGAGFPGVPLLAANPDLDVAFMDSTAKKLGFISSALEDLDLSASFINMRAEDAGRDKEYRESFDLAVSRAVAPLNVLCEYALPLVKVGGSFIAMKGANAEAELSEAQSAVKKLGASLAKTVDVPLTDGKRTLLVFEKVSPVSEIYPRAGGKIKKSPL